MKKLPFYFFILISILAFVLIYRAAFMATQKSYREIARMNLSVEEAARDYLKNSPVISVVFPSCPVYFDENGCIVQYFAEVTKDSGVKHRVEFEFLVQRENRIWKAVIIKVKPNQPMPENKKPAPWDLFRSTPKSNSAE